ncbi:MAG: hypothetical protein LBU32_02710 [Clostridiales bacterium]|jgi:hypothetical protein|nr:hypothetical protein [Clostridiales bacterium]
MATNNQFKTVDEKMFFMSLPEHLRIAITDYENGIKEKSTLLDCYWGELYGSINSAMWNNQITREEASLLREQYLGMGEANDSRG